MILCQIGKDAGGEADACHPLLMQRVGGYLHHREITALVRHFRQQPLQLVGVGVVEAEGTVR